MAKMLDVALSCARQGFKVFPIKPGAKAPPLIVGWQMAATSDPGTIHGWWANWPEANVGIHCDGMVVLDIDIKKGGYDSLVELELACPLPATFEVDTPSGGRHIFFQSDQNVPNGVNVYGPGIDVRSGSGYVVAPGSRTPGGTYRIRNSNGLAGVPPLLLSERYTKQVGLLSQASERSNAPVTVHTEGADTRARTWLQNQEVAQEGTRNHLAYAAAAQCRDFGCTQEETYQLMEENFRAIPLMDLGEILHVVNSAFKYAQNEPGSRDVGYAFDTVEAPSVPVLLHHPSDSHLEAVLRSEYLIKGVLEKQTNAVIFGQWNVGKSFVVLDMAAAIATGTQWFGRRVRKGRVLYLGYEGTRAMQKRMIALREKYPELQDRNSPFSWLPMTMPLTKQAGYDYMRHAIEVFEDIHGGPPDLIIIDPLTNALGGDDADATLMGALNEVVADVMKRYNCTVLRVHHSGHGNQERARGHSSLPAGIDTEIRVTEDVIAMTKQRDDVRGAMSFKLRVIELGKDSDGDAVTTCVVDQVEDNALSGDLTGPQKDYYDALVDLAGEGKEFGKLDANRVATGLGLAPPQRVLAFSVLLKKRFIEAYHRKFRLCERGSLSIFD